MTFGCVWNRGIKKNCDFDGENDNDDDDRPLDFGVYPFFRAKSLKLLETNLLET